MGRIVTIEIPDSQIKPRQTRADRWKQRPTVMRYRAFADRARLCAGSKLEKMRADHVGIAVTIAMPKSWSKKKRAEMNGKPHQSPGDVDNFIKGILDSLWPDSDCHIWSVSGTKHWGLTNQTVVTVTEI